MMEREWVLLHPENNKPSLGDTKMTTLTTQELLATLIAQRASLDAQRDHIEQAITSLAQAQSAGMLGSGAGPRKVARNSPGRPKGSKNSTKTVREPGKRGPGRPKGSKNKPKVSAVPVAEMSEPTQAVAHEVQAPVVVQEASQPTEVQEVLQPPQTF